nr:acidic leucine-rich nuclear phosphoprotein 32 family member E [Drosophila virilis]
MALDNARLVSLAKASQLARAVGSESSGSESEDIEFPSKSKPNDICAKEQQQEHERQRGQPLEYKYSPLSGDSDVDSDVGESMSDESIALLAHEMLCCEHESDTDSGEDDQGEEEEEEEEDKDWIGDGLEEHHEQTLESRA